MLLKNYGVFILNVKNRNMLKRLGCECKNIGDEQFVNIELLSKYSRAKIFVKCDYCGDEYCMCYNVYNKRSRNIKKDACYKCLNIKVKEVFNKKYGVNSLNEIPGRLEKAVVTRKNRTKEEKMVTADKIKVTSMKRYGCEHPMQSRELQLKFEESSFKKYGVRRPTQNKDVMNKVRATLMMKYGVENPTQNEEIKQKSIFKKSSNGTQTSSKQQNLLHQYIGGQLNYQWDNYFIDIAFPEDKIAIEYNGGGHNLGVKLGNITEQQFNRKENFRTKKMFLDDWKIITFISPKNKMLTEYEITCVMDYLINNLFITNHHAEIFIDDGFVKSSKEIVYIKQLAMND